MNFQEIQAQLVVVIIIFGAACLFLQFVYRDIKPQKNTGGKSET